VALQSLQGPWPPLSGGFVILLIHLVGLFWTIDQTVAKTSDYTSQQNTEAQRQTSMYRAGFEPSNQVAKPYALDRAATGTGKEIPYLYET
jgi:hypothetical protein